jgi:hypothetical protein
MTKFEANQARERYDELVNVFPERCRRFGVCPRISDSVDATMIARAKENMDDESADSLPERMRLLGARINRLCRDGQSLDGSCGMPSGDS